MQLDNEEENENYEKKNNAETKAIEHQTYNKR